MSEINIDAKQLNDMVMQDKIRRGTIRTSGSQVGEKGEKKEEFDKLKINKENIGQLEIKKGLSNINENDADSDNERKDRRDTKENRIANLLVGDSKRGNSNGSYDKGDTRRAYEYYKGNQNRREDIFLGQQDKGNKLKDKQAKIANKVDEMQMKLKQINSEIKQKAQIDNYSVNQQEAYQSIVKENNNLKKELQAVQLAKSIVVNKNKDKKLVKTIGNEAYATRDRKKVSDLLKLVDMLKKQLQENENKYKAYQNVHKSSIAQSQFQGGQYLNANNNANNMGLKEVNIKMQGMAAKNDELMNNLTGLRNQLKQCKQENSALTLQLKEAKDNANNLGRQNRSLELSVQSAEEYQKQIIDLKKQRDNTELRLKELLSSPFFKDHGEKATKFARIHELEEESIRLNTVNEQLTKNVDGQKREIFHLIDQVNNYKKVYQDLKEENEELRVDLSSQATKFGPLQQLQQLDHPTYLKTLGALTMNAHKNRMKNINDILKDEGDNPDEEDDEETRINQVRKLQSEIEQLKVEKGEIAIHLEKVQAMLRIQIETAQQREKIYAVEKEASDLKYKALLEKAQELAEITDMKGFLQGENKGDVDLGNVTLHKKGNVDYTDSVNEFSDDEDAQIDESKGQNFFDLWVGNCSIYAANLSKATQGRITEHDSILIFSTVDFYDHETQTTPVCEGTSCFFNFQVSYKINTKGAFLHYLETGSMRIEIYAAFRQDAILVGSADVNLDFLFRNNKRDKVSAVLNQNIAISHHGVAVGEITVKARIRKPISNQIRFYIESKNNELEKFEELEYKQKRAQEQNMPFDELQGLQDETHKRILVIAIEKGQGFNQKSSTFVYYNIQGKDFYTRSVSGSQPNYDHHQKIEISNVSSFLNQVSKLPLQLYVFDDLQPFAGDSDNQDCLGVATVKLDGLNKNQIIDAVLTIYDEKKEKKGTIYAKIFWYEYQDNVEMVSRLGDNIVAKQWEKEFILKLSKALKTRHLNTSNGFMIFDRNNDQVIDQTEFVSSCLGTLNMTEFNRDEVIYFYEKQRQPFNRDVFEALLRPYLIEDKQKLQYLEELSFLEKNVHRKDGESQQQAQMFNIEQIQKDQFIKNNIEFMDNQTKSIKEVNEILSKNTDVLMDQSRKEAIREMVSQIIIQEMRTRSALDVFEEIDSDKNDEINVQEMQKWLQKYGIKASSEEIIRFLNSVDSNKNNTIDLLEFMNYIQKESMTKILYYKKYPKLERVDPQDKLGNYDESKVFSDDQIIQEIEEKIFEFMINKKVKIIDLHSQMDKDKNNSIGKREFRNFFKNKIGVDLTMRDLDVVFQIFDKDNDGSISVKEFVEHLKKAINQRNSLKQLRQSQSQVTVSPQKSAIRFKQHDETDDFNKTTNSRFKKSLNFQN